MDKTTKSILKVMFSMIAVVLLFIAIGFFQSTFVPPKYYESIRESMADNDHVSDQFGEILLRDETEQSIVILHKFGNYIEFMEFAIVYQDGRKVYSPPKGGGSTLETMKVFLEAHGSEENLIKSNINMSRVGSYKKDIEQYGRSFVYGMSQSEYLDQLRIEGQSVDGIIELYTVAGEKYYIWYILDLESDKKWLDTDVYFEVSNK